MNSENVLTSLNGDFNHITKIENQLFEVEKVKLHPNRVGFKSPESYGIYKNVGGDALGVVGSQYTPTQPQFLLDAFLACLAEANINAKTLKYSTFKGDSKIQFSADLNNIEFNNKAKLNDIVKTSLVLTTGYDGLTKTSLALNSHRLVCLNGMTVADTTVNVAFKNTKGNLGKAQTLCYEAAKVIGNLESVTERFKLMDAKELKQSQIDAFMFKLVGASQAEYNEITKRKQNVLDSMYSCIDLEIGRTGATAWGVLNGITYFTNHIANAEKRNDYLYFGNGSKLNTKAQKLLLEVVN